MSANPNLIMFLVANKADLEDQRKVENEVLFLVKYRLNIIKCGNID